MLSYRHGFHAGNHADVLKHLTLALVVRYVQRKDKPLMLVDTHAGAGRYDLTAAFSQKLQEHQHGIAPLLNATSVPEPMQHYLEAVRAENPDGNLRWYPGSPALLRQWQRPQDAITLFELHSTESAVLEQQIGSFRGVRVVAGDGMAGLHATFPPIQRRGVAIIDPSYEDKREYQTVPKALLSTYGRFPTGVYLLWSPVVWRAQTARLIEQIEQRTHHSVLTAELGVRPDATGQGMTASCVTVINPPWSLKAELEESLPWLQRQLAPDTGHFEIRLIER